MNIALLSIIPISNFKEASSITTLAYAKELQNQGHQVIIIAKKRKGLPQREVIKGVRIFRLYDCGKIKSYTKAVQELQQELNLTFDILHSMSATPLFVLASWLAKKYCKQAKVVHTLKSYSKHWSTKLSYPLLNLADHVTVPTQVFLKHLIGVSKKKTSIFHAPINLKKYYPQDKTLLKKKYNYENKKIVLYYGSFHKFKGVDVLIEAIPQIVQENKEVLFIFAPRYKDIPQERARVKELGVEKQVQFLVDDLIIEEYVNLADVVVLPYHSLMATEGNPSCLLEAMACKTPVVVSKLPEIQEVALNTVVYCAPSNHTLLSEKISIVLKKPNQEKIDRAYQKAQEFDVKEITKKMITVYKSL